MIENGSMAVQFREREPIETSDFFASNPSPADRLELFLAFAPAAELTDEKPNLRQMSLPMGYLDAINEAKLGKTLVSAVLEAPFLGDLVNSQTGKLTQTGHDALKKLREQTEEDRTNLSSRAMKFLKHKGLKALVQANMAVQQANMA